MTAYNFPDGRTTFAFDPYKVWPKVQHLFDDGTGHWADTVSVGGNWMEPIYVTCSIELGRLVREILDESKVPYKIMREE